MTRKSFKDEASGFNVKFKVSFTKMDNMGEVNSQLASNGDVQDPRMFLMMTDTEQKIVTDEDGNQFAVIKEGSSVWRLLKLTNSRNGHTIAHELFHNLTHNHKNAPEDIRNQIDPKNQKEGHKKAGGIFVYADERDKAKEEDINQKNIQDVLKSVPEKKHDESKD